MVSEIIIKYGKFLSLGSAVYIESNDIPETGSLIDSSISKLRAYSISVYGPPIIWTGMKLEKGKIKLDRKLIMQCRGDFSKIPIGFERKESVKIGPCVHAQFAGKEENILRAYEKVSVYAYENEIELKKENYTVYVKQDGSDSTIDVFVPMEGDG